MKKKFLSLLFVVLTIYLPASERNFSPEEVLPAVVFIAKEINSFDQVYPYNPDSFYEYLRPFYEWWWPTRHFHGSGFIVSPDGYVVTNDHVVDEGTDFLIVIRDFDLKIYKAKLVGSDPRTDLAVLKIEDPDGTEFAYLKFGNSQNVALGDDVTVIGSPITTESTVTRGIISGKNRNNCGLFDIEGYLQTDAPINAGNSGGPILNENGDVIGVVSFGFSHFWGIEGIGFAIPSNSAEKIVNQFITKGKVSQGFLGIELEDTCEIVFDHFFFDTNGGAQISGIVLDSPADKMGLEPGDLIIEFNNIPIDMPANLRNHLCVLEPGTIVHLSVDREGEILEFTVELGSDELSKKHASMDSFACQIVI
ncbi:MAG: Periplasmic pH-dependent serine endoprotease DegQ [Chlamydiae bacterium]|nr:Periplasmic pH-dependent serine endoprotease DegQ [Chlamydiota bacterium]